MRMNFVIGICVHRTTVVTTACIGTYTATTAAARYPRSALVLHRRFAFVAPVICGAVD